MSKILTPEDYFKRSPRDLIIRPVFTGKQVDEYAEYYHQQMTRWIPVEEGLPAITEFGNSDFVHCVRKNQSKFPHILYYNYQKKGWYRDYYTPVNDVTHWQPLPEPPTK